MRVTALLLPLLAACTPHEREPGVFPVGEPLGDPVQATLGPDGGVLEAADGALTITVPVGAVDADTLFSVQEITRTVPHGDGRAFRLEPHGVAFAQPVTLTFAGDDAAAGVRLAAWQDDEGHWLTVPDSVVGEDGALTVGTTHFSDWTVLEAYRLVTPASTVRTGRTLELEVQSCLHRDLHLDDGLVVPALVATCEAFSLPNLIKAPSVDGVEGGNGTVGTVDRQGARLRYQAPGAVPPEAWVSVSAEVDLLARTKLLVAASVRVVDDVAYQGVATMSDGATDAEAEVTWTESEDHGEVIAYVPRGEVVVRMTDCTISPDRGVIQPDDGMLEIDRSYDPPRYYGGGVTTWQATLTCPDADPIASYPVIAHWLSVATPTDAKDDGDLLEGSDGYWTWSFTAP